MMSNEELFHKCKWQALSSVFWARKALVYHCGEVYDYAPMIQDTLFAKLFPQEAVVGVYEMEAALGRKLCVEELIVCPLSVNYLIFAEPTITGSPQERETLLGFLELIERSVRRYETRTRNYLLKQSEQKPKPKGVSGH